MLRSVLLVLVLPAGVSSHTIGGSSASPLREAYGMTTLPNEMGSR
jgi:hypothetical protein